MAEAARVVAIGHNRPTGAEIAAMIEADPGLVLREHDALDLLLQHLREQIAAADVDLSTDKGRKEIASRAYAIARLKTAIDEAGKTLNESARKQIGLVDARRRIARDSLDGLRDEARQPLTDWEAAEDRRTAAIKAELDGLRSAATVAAGTPSETIRAARAAIDNRTYDPDVFCGQLGYVEDVRQQVLGTLATALARAEQEEADRAELDRLRAEAAERQRQEAERLERERQEREAAEAAERERQRIAEAERRAAELARVEAENRARSEQDRRDREHREAIEAERRRADEAERLRLAEAEKIAREREAAEAAARREAEQAAERERDRDHRSAVMGAAKAAIMVAGQIDEAAARRIVLAIVSGEVPHTRIQF
jgi:colicin import membrane protein